MNAGAAPLASGARIGPNAIGQVASVLRDELGPAIAARVFHAAGLDRHLLTPPREMVDEREVHALHAALRAELPAGQAVRIARDAGRATADYLLAHRIPRPVQWLLRRLPARAAAGVLMTAIGRHAWTFAGSGAFSARAGRPTRFAIDDCPLCRGEHAASPQCDYYAATFERLFRVLVHRGARVLETHCAARGDDACRFRIDW